MALPNHDHYILESGDILLIRPARAAAAWVPAAVIVAGAPHLTVHTFEPMVTTTGIRVEPGPVQLALDYEARTITGLDPEDKYEVQIADATATEHPL